MIVNFESMPIPNSVYQGQKDGHPYKNHIMGFLTKDAPRAHQASYGFESVEQGNATEQMEAETKPINTQLFLNKINAPFFVVCDGVARYCQGYLVPQFP